MQTKSAKLSRVRSKLLRRSSSVAPPRTSRHR
ncbi:hypothetical protein Csa_023545 [Cucumis sativus]|nr:hypothetical protein Csa_023545 [Cucumis sativus]